MVSKSEGKKNPHISYKVGKVTSTRVATGFANHTPDERLVSEIYFKNSYDNNKKNKR